MITSCFSWFLQVGSRSYGGWESRLGVATISRSYGGWVATGSRSYESLLRGMGRFTFS